jgi:hypothetical protein
MIDFEAAARVADAVLYEGYVLYPYRASAAKNQCRWQFGVVAPRAPHEDGEPSVSQTECLIEPSASIPRLSVRVRFLRPMSAPAAVAGAARPWLEGVPHDVDAVSMMSLDDVAVDRVFRIPASGIDARLTIHTGQLGRFVALRLLLENCEPWRHDFGANRDAMLEHSLVGVHLLLAVEGGSFVSLLEPPDDAARLAAGCQNRYTWPVLVGDRSRRNLMLSSPIVLYDFPSVAQESPGDLCDAAEIDEILSLRILTMTDEEKREARATDARARAILDRVEALSPEALGRLHGTLRSADFFNPPGTPSADQAFVTIDEHRIAKGSRVRLRPNRRADAMDMFLKDQPATVAGVYRDVDERVYVAVTIDADPAASLHESFGRFFYFDPAEVEPIDVKQEQV